MRLERLRNASAITRLQGLTCHVIGFHISADARSSGTPPRGCRSHTRPPTSLLLPSEPCSEPGGSACCYWNHHGSNITTRLMDAPAGRYRLHHRCCRRWRSGLPPRRAQRRSPGGHQRGQATRRPCRMTRSPASRLLGHGSAAAPSPSPSARTRWISMLLLKTLLEWCNHPV